MKASVSIITYNHENFIGQALEGAIMQQTNFDYEIVIGEDCSTDHTRDILINYQKRYPTKIRLLLPKKNQGGMWNSIRTMAACQGQYIALLEGDDYWTSPHKLQKQVDFLDHHPECAMCIHGAEIKYEDGSQKPQLFFPPGRKAIYQLADLLQGNFIISCSVMFRKGLFGDFPDWFYGLPIGDWPLYILNAQHGDIGYIDEVMGTYRKHSFSLTSMRTPAEALQTHIVFYEQINPYLNYRFDRLIKRSIAKRWNAAADTIAQTALEQGSLEAAQAVLRQLFRTWPVSLPLTDSWKSKVMGRMYALFVFKKHQESDFSTVRYCLPRAVGHDPTLLKNLGIWSIGFEAFFGRQAASRLRQVARKYRLVNSCAD